MRSEEYFKALVNGERRSLADRLLLTLLRGCAVPYSLAMRLRAAAYAVGLLRSHRLPRPVISVGNITVGGTGKTPMTAWLARYLMSRGKRVAVLSRGYGGTLEGTVAIVSDGNRRLLTPEEAGDEPCLLAELVPGLMVVIGSDRYRAGCLAMERLHPDLFILDDGFQHLRLQRDLDILLLDARQPFANGRILPAGLLRESVSAVGRADLALFTRCVDNTPPDVKLPDGLPACHARHRLTGFTTLSGGEVRRFGELTGQRGLAFAGIADPAGFFDELERQGAVLAATLAFPDHTVYGDEECAALARLRKSARADYLITTAKDGVKLKALGGDDIPCYVATLELEIADAAPLCQRLDKLLQNGR